MNADASAEFDRDPADTAASSKWANGREGRPGNVLAAGLDAVPHGGSCHSSSTDASAAGGACQGPVEGPHAKQAPGADLDGVRQSHHCARQGAAPDLDINQQPHQHVQVSVRHSSCAHGAPSAPLSPRPFSPPAEWLTPVSDPDNGH